jgi:hypothetical protein
VLRGKRRDLKKEPIHEKIFNIHSADCICALYAHRQLPA